MSIKTTHRTAAALRMPGAPSFVVSLGTSNWSSAAPTHAGNGAYTPLSVDIPNPMVVRRDAHVATKQDRPPRGVPR